MIIYRVKEDKDVRRINDEPIYITENNISSFKIIFDETFCNYKIDDLTFEMRCYLPPEQGEESNYISYILNINDRVAVVPITNDITEKPQIVRIVFFATKGETIIGKTEVVEKEIFDAPTKGDPLTPRAQFDEVINEQREIIEQREQTITEQQGTITSQGEQITELSEQVTELTAENQEQAATITRQNTTIDQLNSRVPPVETLEDPIRPRSEAQVITPSEGYAGLASVTVDRVTAEVDSDIQPENIREGVDILGVEGTYNPVYGTTKGGIYITEKDNEDYARKVVIKDYFGAGELILPFGVNGRSRIDEINFIGENNFTSIANYAFQNYVSLTHFIIPNSVTTIGNYAFDGDMALSGINIPNGVTNIGSYAFQNCKMLDGNVLTLPDTVTTIGQSAFQSAKLKGFTMSSNVKSIGQSAFSNVIFSDQEKIVIPTTCTSLSQYTFSGSNISQLEILANVTSIPTSFLTDGGNNPLELYIGEGIETLGVNCLYNRGGLWKLYLPSTLTSIGNQAFTFAGRCRELTLGNGWNMTFNAGSRATSTIEKSFVVGWLNALKDLTGETAKTLTIGSTNLAKLTAEEIAIATNKNWNLA